MIVQWRIHVSEGSGWLRLCWTNNPPCGDVSGPGFTIFSWKGFGLYLGTVELECQKQRLSRIFDLGGNATSWCLRWSELQESLLFLGYSMCNSRTTSGRAMKNRSTVYLTNTAVLVFTPNPDRQARKKISATTNGRTFGSRVCWIDPDKSLESWEDPK